MWWDARPPAAGVDVFFHRDLALLSTEDLLALRRFLQIRLSVVEPRRRARWPWSWTVERLRAVEAELARRGQARHPKAGERRG
ncbi:MAG: hypothetical protein QN155_03675 [Armatimonadota bacterium]|nr:hypothetical protein [Armatimonadota bacterium]